jgi:hypothetical protein
MSSAMIVLQGKEGAFPLRDFATQGERLTAAYGMLGRVGPDAAREMGAMIQMIRQGVGSSDQATTAMEAYIRNLQDVEKSKKLASAGIQLTDPDDPKRMRSLVDITRDIVTKTGGDFKKLGTVFDAEAMRALAAASIEFKNTGDLGSLDKYMAVVADGSTLIADASTNAGSFNASLMSMTTAAQQFADNNLTAPVQGFADALNALDPATQAKAVDALGYSILGLGAAVLTWKAAKVGLAVGKGVFAAGRGVAGLLGRGRGGAGGAAGAVGGALAGAIGPTPVMVVNWPGGMMGGGMMGGGAASPILGPDGQPVRRAPDATPNGTPPGNPPGNPPRARGWRGAAAGLAARGGQLAGGLARSSGALTAAYYGSMAVANLAQGDVKGAASEGGAGMGALGGAALGAKGGAMIGTMIMPGIGTAVGGAIGAMGGAVIGSEAGRWIAEELAGVVSKGWDALTAEQKPQVVEGKVAVEINGLPPGSRVTSVSSKGGLELDVDAGLMMGTP